MRGFDGYTRLVRKLSLGQRSWERAKRRSNAQTVHWQHPLPSARRILKHHNQSHYWRTCDLVLSLKDNRFLHYLNVHRATLSYITPEPHRPSWIWGEFHDEFRVQAEHEGHCHAASIFFADHGGQSLTFSPSPASSTDFPPPSNKNSNAAWNASKSKTS